MASSFLISLFLLSLVSLSSAQSSDTLMDAAEILSDSGYESMALTLELASKSVIPVTPSLTVFAPADSAFAHSGQPPLTLLQYHLLPLAFSYRCLQSLPFGARIPSMLANHSLIITTTRSDSRISINNVRVNGSPIYDDGSLIIFGIDHFFNPYFRVSHPKNRSKNVKDRVCVRSNSSYMMELTVDHHHHPFDEACAVMRSRGCSVMASLLEMQFIGFKDQSHQTMLTIFSPIDQAMVNRKTNVSEFSSIFRRHIIPCRLWWRELVDFEDGTELQSNLEGFTIKITGSSKGLRINGVPVILPDMYHNDLLVVHGISEILEGPKHEEKVPESFYGFGNENEENTNTVAHYHFSVFRS